MKYVTVNYELDNSTVLVMKYTLEYLGVKDHEIHNMYLMGHKKVLCVNRNRTNDKANGKMFTLGESWIKPVKDLCIVFYFATLYKFEITPK